MKTAIVAFYLLLALISLGQERSSIWISTRWLGDDEREALSKAVVESYSDQLHQIREGMRSSMPTQDPEFQVAFKPPLHALDAIVEQGDMSAASELLPFIDWLHGNQGHPIAGLLGGEGVKGTLNYLIDGIFSAEMLGTPDAVDEHKMEAMLRFYAGNPAQTSEGSWQRNNTMLFVFGNRVVDCLASKAPDRIAAFYQAVQDARKAALIGPGPDEEAIPAAERPTAEQLRNYEAAFASLKMLSTGGVLPKADPTANQQQSSTSPQVPSHVQPPAPKKPTDQKPAPLEPVAKSPASTRWPVAAVVIVAASGLLWLLIKRRS